MQKRKSEIVRDTIHRRKQNHLRSDTQSSSRDSTAPPRIWVDADARGLKGVTSTTVVQRFKEREIQRERERERTMTELGRVTFSPDTTPSGGSPGEGEQKTLSQHNFFLFICIFTFLFFYVFLVFCFLIIFSNFCFSRIPSAKLTAKERKRR